MSPILLILAAAASAGTITVHPQGFGEFEVAEVVLWQGTDVVGEYLFRYGPEGPSVRIDVADGPYVVELDVRGRIVFAEAVTVGAEPVELRPVVPEVVLPALFWETTVHDLRFEHEILPRLRGDLRDEARACLTRRPVPEAGHEYFETIVLDFHLHEGRAIDIDPQLHGGLPRGTRRCLVRIVEQATFPVEARGHVTWLIDPWP